MDHTLRELLDSSLQWIFVGGKGGVGKTTTSCSLATLFAATPICNADGSTRPRRVLLISTDPAHNLSDAFNQKIGPQPTEVKRMEGTLFAMEIDPHSVIKGQYFSELSEGNTESTTPNAPSGHGGDSNESPLASILSVLKQAVGNLPGVDEVAVFAEILHCVQKLSFDVVLFDTAPTGHTLRLLALPKTLSSTINDLMELEHVAPLLEAASGMLQSTLSDTSANWSLEGMRSSLHTWREKIEHVQRQFNDPERTAFVCVCIPEFLSVYETERLVQELMKYDINCDSLVVNQLVMRPASEPPCRMCSARQKIQGKYLEQIDSLYEDFHIVKMPLLSDEVRGVEALKQFARFLMEPYDPNKHGYVELGSC